MGNILKTKIRELAKKKNQKKSVEKIDLSAPPQPAALPGDDLAMPTREVLKPDNQLQLNEQQLNEEIAKMLVATNPAASKNIVRFNLKERCFKFEPMVDQNMVHYHSDGWTLYRDSDEAKKQIESHKLEQENMQRFMQELERNKHDKRDEGTDTEGPDDSKCLRNQFNFGERATQTLNNLLKDRDTITEPPPKAQMEGSTSIWGIYDEYVRDMYKQKIQEEQQKLKAAAKKGLAQQPAAQDVHTKPEEVKNKDEKSNQELAATLKTMERMINQNTYIEVALDFKYWDDITDQYKEGEGTLLPLWKFQLEDTKRKTVTSMQWHSQFTDLFLVGYGQFDFLRQSSGVICAYSLKNPSYPEKLYTLVSGIMCLDVHTQHSQLLAVGCYDGTVIVYDLSCHSNKPLYQSTVKSNKHTDPVWQVKWQEVEAGKPLSFYSVSTDGRVSVWELSKADLTCQNGMVLRLQKDQNEAQENQEITNNQISVGGCCFDFNPEHSHLYLVGTEEGSIHLCSKAYSSQYLQTYEGHTLAVYAVRWNQISKTRFLSASCDWTVKLWDQSKRKALMSFDLGNPVGDVAWAPYGSTVFVGITNNGKVHVFDIYENAYEPLCEQKVAKNTKLSKVAFNPKYPVILVGDERGTVTSLKLSPNLRKSLASQGQPNFEEKELQQLNSVIEVALKSKAIAGESL